MRPLIFFGVFMVATLANAATPAQTSAPLANEALLHSARMWEARDRGDLAQLALEKLVAARPDSADALLELGELHLRAADLPAAAQVLERLNTRFKNSAAARTFETEYRFASRDRLQLASVQRLIQIGQGAQARAELNRLFPQGAPGGALGIQYYGLLASTPGGWQRADAGLRTLAAAHADNPRYRLALAQLLIRREQTRLEGMRMLNALAKRDDVRSSEVDDALAGAMNELGYGRVPAEILRDYVARRPADAKAKAAITQSARASEAAELLSRNALAAIQPELQQRLLREFETRLQAAGATPAKTALALLNLLQGALPESAAFINDSSAAAALWRERSRQSAAAQNFALAAAELEAALAFARNNPEAVIAIADRMETLKAPEQGGELLATASRLEPSSNWLFESHVRWLLNHARATEALALLEARPIDKTWTAESRDALRAAALDQRAQQTIAAGDTNQAAVDLEQAVRLAPRAPWSRYRLAGLYAKAGAADRGRQLMTEGARLASGDTEMRYAQALYLSSIEDYAAAIAALDDIAPAARSAGMNELRERLRIDTARARARDLKGAGDLVGARAALMEVEALAQDNLERARELAAAWIEFGEPERGLALLDAHRKANADDKAVLLAWAEALNRAEDMERLAPALDRLHGLSPLDDQDQLQIAALQRALDLRRVRALERDEKYLEAAQRLDELLARDPDDRALRIARADLELAAGRSKAARDRYAALAAEAPEDLGTRLSYVRALTESGDVSLARLQLQWVQEQLAANDVETRLGIARRQIALGDSTAALQTLQPLPATPSERAEALLLAGRAALSQRQFAQARDYFAQAEQMPDPAPAAAARLLREEIEARLQSFMAAGFEFRHKSGEAGSSQFDAMLLPSSWQFARNYQSRMVLRADAVTVDAGDLSADFNSSALLGTIQAVGAGATRRYANTRQNGLSLGLGYVTDNFTADVGATPLGFLIPNIVGGVEWTPQWKSLDLTLGIARRAVTSSVLSYAGLRDPITGEKWGGVVESGPYAGFGLYRERYSVSGSVRAAEFTGAQVLRNRFLGARAAADWKFLSRPEASIFLGLTVNYWNYRHNLQNYTFGSGGYYSPHSYVGVALPLELQGARNGWSYRLRAAVSHSVSSFRRIAFYPQDAGLQNAAMTSTLPAGYDEPYFSASRSHGASLSAYAAVERQLSRAFVMGAKLDLDRADYYRPTVFMLYFRHAFAAGSSSIATPPEPVRLYNDL